MTCKSGVDDGIVGIGDCASGCPDNGAAENTYLVARLPASTRCQPGQDVFIDFLGQIPLTDRYGRHAHIAEIMLEGTMRFTTLAASDEVLGRNMLSLWDEMFLEDSSGWLYTAGIDGRQWRDDQFFRYGIVDPKTNPSDLATNVGAGTHDVDISMSMFLTRPDNRGRPSMIGAIPLAALTTRDGNAPLRFTCGTALPGNPAGVTVTGFQGTVRVWARVFWLPFPMAFKPWQLETYTLDNLSGTLRRPRRAHEYCVLRPFTTDTGGEDLSDYGNLTLTLNGEVLIKGLSADEMSSRDNRIVMSDAIVGKFTLLDDSLPFTSSGVALAQLLIPQAKHFAAMASGVVGYEWDARTVHVTNRFLHRTVACHNAERAKDIARRAGCGTDVAPVGVTPNGDFVPPSPTMPIAFVPSRLIRR